MGSDGLEVRHFEGEGAQDEQQVFCNLLHND